MGHLGFWSLRSSRRRGRRKGRKEEGRGRLRWDIWDSGAGISQEEGEEEGKKGGRKGEIEM